MAHSHGVITTANNAETNIQQSIIANNTCVDSVFCNVGANSKSTLNYNNIQNNSASGLVNTVGTLDLENNYWGSNDLPDGVTATVWVVEENGSYKLSNGNELEKSIPELTDDGDEPVTTVNDTIYVDSVKGNDTNDGFTEDTAVKTIAKAIEISTNGKIILLNGTHKTGDLGSIYKDLTITAQGEAIVDAQNNNRVLYVGTSGNVLIEGVTFINGYTSDESGALFGNAGNLTIINCTLANSTSSKNGGAIYNAANLIVVNSTFENNRASQNGGAIFTQSAGIGITPTLAVSNSSFTENSAAGTGNFGGGAIFAQQAADGLSIENSNFTLNSVEKSGGGAVEIVNVNVATITGCNFVSNYAKGEDSESNYGGGAISFVGAYSDKKKL